MLEVSWRFEIFVEGNKLAEAAEDVTGHDEGWLNQGLLYRRIIVACQLSCHVRR